MTTLNSQGFTRSRLDERLALLQAAVQAIFGTDINLDPDSIDGQTLGIFAESISNLDQLAEDVYHSFNPQSSTGVALSRLVQLNGIRRIEGIYSTATLRCVGQQGTVIPAGSLVKSTSNNATFETVVDATIDATGQVDVAARSSIKGAIAASAGTLTKIDTPIYGWQTVTNLTEAIVGRDEESDEQLRIRRRASTATPGQAVVDSIYGALANLSDVKQARVYENDQDVIDSLGLPAHSIYCVVEGGSESTIADTIWLKKTAGTTTVGDLTINATDSQGFIHPIHFSRPEYVDLYIVVNISQRAGFPSDGAQRIKDALVKYGLDVFTIGMDAIQSRLFDPVNTVPNHAITSLYIGTAPGPTGVADVIVPFDGLARIDVSRITVNVS